MQIGETPIKSGSDVIDAITWQMDMEGRSPGEAIEDLEAALCAYGDRIQGVMVGALLVVLKELVKRVDKEHFKEALKQAWIEL